MGKAGCAPHGGDSVLVEGGLQRRLGLTLGSLHQRLTQQLKLGQHPCRRARIRSSISSQHIPHLDADAMVMQSAIATLQLISNLGQAAWCVHIKHIRQKQVRRHDHQAAASHGCISVQQERIAWLVGLGPFGLNLGQGGQGRVQGPPGPILRKVKRGVLFAHIRQAALYGSQRPAMVQSRFIIKLNLTPS